MSDHQSDHLIACISMAPIEQIFVKFDIEDFYENLSGNSKFGYSLTKMLGALREDQSTFIFLTAVQNIV
jgi:hypothetical protein